MCTPTPSYSNIYIHPHYARNTRVHNPYRSMTSCIYGSYILIPHFFLSLALPGRWPCNGSSHAPGSSRTWLPILYALFDNTAEQQVAQHGVVAGPCASTHNSQRLLTRAFGTHRTACTTSIMTALVGISSLSTPGKPSARVGPTLRYRTGLRNSSACFNRLTCDVNDSQNGWRKRRKGNVPEG